MILMMRLRQIFIVTYFHFVSGQDGRCDGPLVCCRGFEYNEKEDTCHPCNEPKYGAGCMEICNCSEEEMCDRFKGCVNRTITTVIAPTTTTRRVKDTSHSIINQSMRISETHGTNHPKIAATEVGNRKGATTEVDNRLVHMPFPYLDKPLLFSIIILSFVLGVVFSLYMLTYIVDKMKLPATVELTDMRQVRYEVGNPEIIHMIHNTNRQ